MEIGTSIQFLKAYSQLPDPEEVIEDTPGRRVVTKYVPLGWSPSDGISARGINDR